MHWFILIIISRRGMFFFIYQLFSILHMVPLMLALRLRPRKKKTVPNWYIDLHEALCWIQCVVIHSTQSNVHPSYRRSQFWGRSEMNCLLYVLFDHIIKTQTINWALVSLKNSGVWLHLFLRWRTCEIFVMFWQENKQPCILHEMICRRWIYQITFGTISFKRLVAQPMYGNANIVNHLTHCNRRGKTVIHRELRRDYGIVP